jgi:hypothetical protein
MGAVAAVVSGAATKVIEGSTSASTWGVITVGSKVTVSTEVASRATMLLRSSSMAAVSAAGSGAGEVVGGAVVAVVEVVVATVSADLLGRYQK